MYKSSMDVSSCPTYEFDVGFNASPYSYSSKYVNDPHDLFVIVIDYLYIKIVFSSQWRNGMVCH